MSIEGSIQERNLTQVLTALARRDRTGILTVQGATEIIALSFLEGEIVSADALNLTLEDGLGAVLADLDLVSPEDFAGLAAEHQAGGGRVAELLVERSFVTRRQLLGAIRTHTYRLSREVVSWAEGEYKFYQGEEVSYEPGLTPIPVAELISRAHRDLGRPERPELSFPESSSVYARSAGAFDAGLGSRGGEAEPPEVAELGEEARDLFARLDGGSSVAELAEATELPPFAVRYLIYRLERQQLVELTGSTAVTVAEPSVELEVPDLPLRPAPQPGRQRESLGERVGRLLPSSPKLSAELFDWAGRLAGIGLVLWVALQFVFAAAGTQTVQEGLLLPPAAQESLRRQIDLQRVHRGSRTFFHLYGRYPEELSALERLRLRRAPRFGDELEYRATAVSYVVTRPALGDRGPATETRTISGNFLLDPDFGVVERGGSSARPPLVLLD